MTADQHRNEIARLARLIIRHANNSMDFESVQYIESAMRDVQAVANKARQVCNEWKGEEQ